MQYFILLCLFPPEIVNIIFKFVLKDKSAKLIYHNLKSYILKKNMLFNSIKHIVYHDVFQCNSNGSYTKYKIYSSYHIDCLEYLYYNNYSKMKCDIHFWNHYLNYLSKRLMDVYNKIWIYSLDNNKTKCYQNFKKAVFYWFELCKKHNINLKLGTRTKRHNISNNEYIHTYVNANNINNIKNFNKFVYPPSVLNYEYEILELNDIIDSNTSYNYLHNYLWNNL